MTRPNQLKYAATQKAARALRRQNHECVDCGAPAAVLSAYCRECTDKRLAANKRSKSKRGKVKRTWNPLKIGMLSGINQGSLSEDFGS